MDEPISRGQVAGHHSDMAVYNVEIRITRIGLATAPLAGNQVKGEDG